VNGRRDRRPVESAARVISNGVEFMPTKRRRDDHDDEEDDRPVRRPRPRRKSSGTGTRIALIVGGGVACLVLVVVLIAASGRKSKSGDENASLGRVGQNIDHHEYATVQGVEKVVGRGRAVPQGEWSRIRLTHEGSDGKEEMSLAGWLGITPLRSQPTVYHWSGKDEDMYVAFWPGPSRSTDFSPSRVAVMHYHAPGQRSTVMKSSGYGSP
jgi:hypothetical protein